MISRDDYFAHTGISQFKPSGLVQIRSNKVSQNGPESYCAGLWAQCPVLFALLGPLLGHLGFDGRRLLATSLRGYWALLAYRRHRLYDRSLVDTSTQRIVIVIPGARAGFSTDVRGRIVAVSIQHGAPASLAGRCRPESHCGGSSPRYGPTNHRTSCQGVGEPVQ